LVCATPGCESCGHCRCGRCVCRGTGAGGPPHPAPARRGVGGVGGGGGGRCATPNRVTRYRAYSRIASGGWGPSNLGAVADFRRVTRVPFLGGPDARFAGCAGGHCTGGSGVRALRRGSEPRVMVPGRVSRRLVGESAGAVGVMWRSAVGGGGARIETACGSPGLGPVFGSGECWIGAGGAGGGRV